MNKTDKLGKGFLLRGKTYWYRRMVNGDRLKADYLRPGQPDDKLPTQVDAGSCKFFKVSCATSSLIEKPNVRFTSDLN